MIIRENLFTSTSPTWSPDASQQQFEEVSAGEVGFHGTFSNNGFECGQQLVSAPAAGRDIADLTEFAQAQNQLLLAVRIPLFGCTLCQAIRAVTRLFLVKSHANPLLVTTETKLIPISFK
jgi:hypothetical protein